MNNVHANVISVYGMGCAVLFLHQAQIVTEGIPMT